MDPLTQTFSGIKMLESESGATSGADQEDTACSTNSCAAPMRIGSCQRRSCNSQVRSFFGHTLIESGMQNRSNHRRSPRCRDRGSGRRRRSSNWRCRIQRPRGISNGISVHATRYTTAPRQFFASFESSIYSLMCTLVLRSP